VLLVLLAFTGPLQYLPRCVLAAIVFTIAVGMIDRKSGRVLPCRRHRGRVVTIGVEEGILLAIVLSLLRHVRHSYRPHTMVLAPNATGRWTLVPVTPGAQTEPGLIIYRFGADLFYANDHRFTDEVRSLVEHAPTPVRWFIVDADAIADIDYSARSAPLRRLARLAERPPSRLGDPHPRQLDRARAHHDALQCKFQWSGR
jgi:SulP family sulfate permease